MCIFQKIQSDYKLGIVANYETAKKFSIETQYHPNPFGGHNFWLSNNNWKYLLYTKCLKIYEYKSKYNSEHRGGWNTLKTYMLKNDILKV